MGTTSVDTHALRVAAQRLDEAADYLDAALGRHLSGLRLCGVDRQARSQIGQLVDGVARWQRSARECAFAVRAGADCYAGRDGRDAERFR